MIGEGGPQVPLHPKDGEGDQPKAGGGVSTIRKARQLRREMTLPERLLWQRLRGRSGLKVRRQHPVGPYIADFYVALAKMVIEIDGTVHDATVAQDARRDAFMSDRGLRVLRIPAADILRNVDLAADAIFRAALPLHPAAARRGPPPHAAHGEEIAGAA